MKKELLVLGLIVFLAAFLRFYQLGVNPPSLSWDEAAWGYNAYSLGLTGRDEFGRFLPWDYLESFGDFKPPVYAYLTVLPVKILGLNEVATRLPSAFFGTLTVLLTYFLVKELFPIISPQRSRQAPPPRCLALPLIASFLLTISPWHIMLSRAAFEANVATFFLVGGVTFFLRGLRRGCFLPLSALFFSLSLYTFNTARIVAPLLVIGLGMGCFKKLVKKKKWVLVSLVVGFCLAGSLIPFLLSSQAQLRFHEVNIFSDSQVIEQANKEIANDGNAFWSRVIHNRRWGFFRRFLRHYFDHFKPSFLFFKGDGNPKFSTQDVGELYLWELPFLVGGVFLWFRRKRKLWWLIPFWLLIGIIPAATARETPHALRIATTLPTWQILTAFGLVEFLNWLKKSKIKRVLRASFFIFTFSFLLFNFIYFQHGYWRHYPVEFSGEWQYGYEPAIEFIKKVEDQYDEIWFTDVLGRPYIYFLFYLQEKPEVFWQEAQVERDVFGFVGVKGFGKYHFFRTREDRSSPGRALYVDVPGNVPDSAWVVKTFSLLNGEGRLAAFER